MLPWKPKHHTISDFTKNGIFNETGIFKANYLLPARQYMHNFKHILPNIHLQYKHKIIVFKFLMIVTMATGIVKNSLLCSKELLRKMKFAQGKM